MATAGWRLMDEAGVRIFHLKLGGIGGGSSVGSTGGKAPHQTSVLLMVPAIVHRKGSKSN